MCYEPQRARTVMSLWSSFCTDFAGPGVASVFLASLTLCCVHYSFCPSHNFPHHLASDCLQGWWIWCAHSCLCGILLTSPWKPPRLLTSFLHTSTTRITWIMTVCHYSNCPPFPMWLSVSWAESMSSSQRNISLGSLVMK